VVGLRCQSPYRSGTEAHVRRLLSWVNEHAPELLPDNPARGKAGRRAPGV